MTYIRHVRRCHLTPCLALTVRKTDPLYVSFKERFGLWFYHSRLILDVPSIAFSARRVTLLCRPTDIHCY